MSRSDDARLFFDMYWRGAADMYAEPVSRANAGDPFWWAALTIIAEDGHVFSGRPLVQYVDYCGEARQEHGRTVLPLFSTWGFSKANADRLVIGTLRVPIRKHRHRLHRRACSVSRKVSALSVDSEERHRHRKGFDVLVHDRCARPRVVL